MIVGLKFSNFKSYRDTAEFSFLALESDFNAEAITTVKLNDGSTLRLLNSAVIFGANASGKSNVIWALASLANTVDRSLTYTVKSAIPFIWPYAFDRTYLNKPTVIELDFVYDGKRYVYKVAGKNNVIQVESLKEIQGDKHLIVFSRNSKIKISTGKGWNSDKKILNDSKLLPNQLLLSWLATKDSAGLQDVASYIAGLDVNLGSGISGSKFDRQMVMDTVIKSQDSKVFSRLQALLAYVDLGVRRINVTRNNDSAFKLPDSIDAETQNRIMSANRWNIRLSHITNKPNELCALDFESESEGTKSLFSVGARLLAALDAGSFVAYDEINDAIHPVIMRLLVSFFHSKVSNPKGAQLLFSTHDASVADHNMLRSDQVWFVEKADSVSDLFSAQDFEDVGIQVPFEAWYRAGRFGALPKVGNIMEIFKS